MQSSPIVIIGGGIIGASIAYYLAKSGVSEVLVLDRGKLGAGSTSAALGGFRHQFSNALSVLMSIESIATISRFKELTDYDPLMRPDGYIFIASRESSMRALEKNVELQRRLGVEVGVISAESLANSFPFYNFQGILGGTICMEDGHASTLAMHQGFVSRSKEMGVEFQEYSEVTGIKIEDNVVMSVSVSDKEIPCQKLVIAAGPYSGIVGGLAESEIPVSPLPRRVLVTHSFSDGIPATIPLIIDIDSTLAVGREGKGMLMGDNRKSSVGFDLVFPNDHDDKLLSMAVERIPSLANSSISYAVQGLYEMTPDSNPIISSIPEISGLFCCSGFSGHGFMHSPAAGSLMSELVLDRTPHLDISSLDIRRFQNKEIEKERLII